MKKLFLLIPIILVLLFTITSFAAEDVIFVSASGNDNASGSESEPLCSFYAAFRALPYGGTVVVCDAIKLESFEFPKSNGKITITSVYGGTDYRASNGASVTLTGNLYLKSAVKFEKLNFIISKADINIVLNGNHTVFGDEVNISLSSSDFTYPRITVGAMGLVAVDGGYVEIHSGTFSRIYGGSAGTNSVTHSGDTAIVIYGGTFCDVFYMAGVTKLLGNTNIYIYGGTFNMALVGAALADIDGNLNIFVHGGSFESYIRPVTSGNLNGNCTINLLGGNISKVYNVDKGTINGTLNINLASGISLSSCPFTTSTLSNSAANAIVTENERAIASASNEKYPTITENPITSRDNTYVGAVSKITKFDKTIPGGDIDGDGKVSLLDAIKALKACANDTYIESADINEDKGLSIYDFLAIVKSAINSGALISEYSVDNKISSDIYIFGGESATVNTIAKGFAFGAVPSGAYSMHSKVTLAENAVVGLYFGCEKANPDTESGYYFEVNTEKETLTVYKIISGDYRTVAERKLNLLSNEAEIKLEFGKNAENSVQLYFNDNPLVNEHYFDFDLVLAPHGDGVGIYVENAVATTPIVSAENVEEIPTYNNFIIGNITDPEIFYENGVYYIYGTKSGGTSAGVQCFTTRDFVNFESRGVVLAKTDAYGDKSIVAANIVKQDGIYYMFYLQESSTLGVNTTAFATSSSPLGPFVTENKVPLTDEKDLIGGQPFVDEDGTVYLVYTRTTGGNKAHIARVILDNGKATLDLETERLLLLPTEDWEYAKASVLECGYLIKHNGTYYLLYAGGNYNSTYGVGYATSDNVYGPYTKYVANPIMWSNDQAFGNGAVSTFASPDGNEHFVIYLRNNSPTTTRPLNTCMDRIRFVPNPKGGPDILEIAGASVTPQPLPSGIGNIYDIDYQTARWHW